MRIRDLTVPKKPSTPNFETALAELEQLVEKMESGNQTLEDALKSFQRGIELTRACQEGLKEAEQRVEKLVQQNGTVTVEPYQDDEPA